MKIRNLLEGLPNERGLFDVGNGAVVEIIEPKARFEHRHIVSVYPEGSPLEAGFEGGPVFAFRIEDGLCDVETGAVFDRDNNLIAESFGTLPLVERYIRQTQTAEKIRATVAERVVLPLANLRMANFCRWWFDSMAKIAISEMATSLPAGDKDIYVPKKLTASFQRESTNVLKQNFSLVHSKTVRGNIVTSPGITYLGGQRIGKSALQAASILKRYVYQKPEGHISSGRIFITRRNASIRRIVDEERIFAALEPLGFELVDLSEVSLQRQCEIFDLSEVIVSPHGAGLTNLIWSNDNLRLVEIFSEKGVHGSAFLRLASHIGLRYHAFIGADGENRDKRDNPNNSDIIVDPALLVAFLIEKVLP